MWFNFPPLRFKNQPYKLLVKIIKILAQYKYFYYICNINIKNNKKYGKIKSICNCSQKG